MISIAEIGIVMPMATSIAWHRVFGCPTRWSPDSNRNEPIAIAGPVAAMITGAGKVRHRTDSSKPPASMPSAAFASPDWNTARSKPPLNTRWLPASTTAFAESFSARSSASLMAACMSGTQHIDLAVVEGDRRDGFVEFVANGAGHRLSFECGRFQTDVT